LIGFLEFHEAIHRLLARRHGERALLAASIYMRPDDGRLRLEVPDPRLTHDECEAATDLFVLSLRAGDNVAFVEIDGVPQRISVWYWYAHPQPDESDSLVLRDQDGRRILIDEERFEAWLTGSGVLEAQPTGNVISGDHRVAAGATAQKLVSDHAARRLPKPGYEIDDEPLLREMVRLMDSRECSSVWAAAQRVAPQARGGGTLESKVKRLHRRYRERSQNFSEAETE
jgi:hypothetical protein